MKVFKNKKLNGIGYISIAVATLILSLLIKGWSPLNFTLNPEVKIKKIAGEKEAAQLFSNDEFQLYYVNTDDDITHYAFSKKFGIWYTGYYPHMNDIIGITHGNNYIYYYGKFASNGDYDYIENVQGEKIYPFKNELNGKPLNVYQIPKAKDKNVVYRFMDEENFINDDSLFLNGEAVFYKYENGEHKEYKYTIGQLKQEEPNLWAQIEKTAESADKDVEIEDGRVYTSQQDIIYRIYVSYNTGDFLSLEKGHKGYHWTGEVAYDIEVKGEHPNTIGIYKRDYSTVSLYEKTFGENHVYPVTIPGELIGYFEE